MIEMKYSSIKQETILDKGTYKNFDYIIMNYGTHPCCYVAIPKEHKFFEKNYDDIDIDCHGGITFSNYRDFGDGKEYYIGWDYAHLDDFMGFYELDCLKELGYSHETDKKWTTEELLEDVRKVIEQL